MDIPVLQNEVPREHALDFITGGSAWFTVVNTATGQTLHDCRITRKNKEDTVMFVRIGGLYCGRVFPRKDSFEFVPPIVDVKPEFGKFQWFFNGLVLGTLPESVRVLHKGKCGACGRPLKDPSSLITGIGPVCAGGRASLKKLLASSDRAGS